MDVYNSLSNLVNPDFPNYLMSTVDEADAKQTYEAFLKFKDVVKANSINPADATSSVSGGKIDDVAAKLSADAYAFMKDIDWTSNFYLKQPCSVTANNARAAINKALVMCDGIDSKALHDTSRSWKAIAPVLTSKVMDVCNAFAKITDGGVLNQLYSTMHPQDTIKAYNAFLNFKDVVQIKSV